MNVAGSKHAIKVAADNVTIDMNGFSMVCLSDTTGTAITSAAVARNNVRVLNGAIRGHFQGGINLWGVATRVERVTVMNTFGDAIWCQAQSTIRDCVATSNTGYGILCGNESTVSGCSCDANTMGGISTGGQTVVERCTANNSTGSNASGITVWNSSLVRDCTANSNPIYGFQTSYMCRVENCTANLNLYTGFEIAQNNQLRGCRAHEGNWGIYAQSSCTIIDCEVEGCSYDGIRCDGGCLIQGCRAESNARDGINGGFISTILNCQVYRNFSAGIEVFGQGRVEGNDAVGNVVGFRSTGTGALFIRNSATGSTTANYSIAAGNTAGPIVTPANIATNTNPAANFSY
jgi:hypothetical protein